MSILTALFTAPLAKSSVVAELRVDGEMNGSVTPGQPADWTSNFYYMSTGEPVTEVEQFHDKFMHMVVISNDLKTFAHIHPDWDPQTATFHLRINAPSNDPDNQDAAQVISQSGEHFVFTEVKLQNSEHMVHGMHFVDGRGEQGAIELPEVETECNHGIANKFCTADGHPGQAGDTYRIQISCYPITHDNFKTTKFSFLISQKDGTSYQPVSDLQPWLGMAGHAMAISYQGDSVGAKTFRHMHAMKMPNKPGILNFILDEMHGGITQGNYKLWLQFKHNERVFTVPFTFYWDGYP